MDLTPLMQEIAKGGTMAVLAVIVFYIARKDYIANKEELLQLRKEAKDDKTILINLVQENIKGISVLTEMVRAINVTPYIGVERRKKEV